MNDVYDRLVADNPRIAALHPVERYADEWIDAQRGRGYAFVGEASRSVAHRIEQGEGRAALQRYHRIVLACLAARAEREVPARGLPASIAALIRSELARIDAELERQEDAFYDPGNDLFLKDMGICTFRLLPCGAELVQVEAGVPRRVLLRGGPSQLLRGLAFFGLVTRGFRPMYALHMDPRNTGEFSPEGWDRTYLRIAELMARDPAVKGLFGSAWFYDPAVAAISPHLAYVRERREAAGARRFRGGESAQASADALATSRTRRRAFEAGRYRPATYYLVWPRDRLLAWARAHAPEAFGAPVPAGAARGREGSS
jgi:hypothetical protein